jgi:hypothetical protein
MLASSPSHDRRQQSAQYRGREGFVTASTGRETAPARASQDSPAMTASSEVRNRAQSARPFPTNVRKTLATATEDAVRIADTLNVKIVKTTICGADLHILKGDVPFKA